MDTSSSEELESDSEIDEIAESVWKKTKTSLGFLSDEEHESDSECESVVPKHSVKKTDCRPEENKVVDDSSLLFVIDKGPSATKDSDLRIESVSSELDRENNDYKLDKTGYRGSTSSQKRNTEDRMKLSSSLQVDEDPSNIYIQLHSKKVINISSEASRDRLTKEQAEVLKKSVVTPDFERKNSVPIYEEGLRRKKRENKKEREKSKGGAWYNMPRGEVTEQTKNDLLALKMRRALDPKRFYKSDDMKGLPKYFQFGTVVEDPSEFYSARIPKKQRKKTIVEELMADTDFNSFNKRKYKEVQEMKAKGLGPYKGIRTSRIKRKKKNK